MKDQVLQAPPSAVGGAPSPRAMHRHVPAAHPGHLSKLTCPQHLPGNAVPESVHSGRGTQSHCVNTGAVAFSPGSSLPLLCDRVLCTSARCHGSFSVQSPNPEANDTYPKSAHFTLKLAKHRVHSGSLHHLHIQLVNAKSLSE